MKTNESLSGERGQFVEYLVRQIVGPVDGDSELVEGEPPHKRYLSGMLYPQESTEINPLNDDDDVIEDQLSVSRADDGTDDALALSGQLYPSSMGLSFVISGGASLVVEIRCARYQKEGSGWRRTAIELTGGNSVKIKPGTTKVQILEGAATLDVVWRTAGMRQLVTVSLVNRLLRDERGRVDGADCLMQASLRCSSAGNSIHPYPVRMNISVSPEEEELALLYRNVPIYAVGHGVSTEWGPPSQGGVTWVATSSIPMHQVPGVAFDLEDPGPVLSLGYMSSIEDDLVATVAALHRFVDRYADWISDRRSEQSGLPRPLAAAAGRLMERLDAASTRMRSGIALIQEDPQVRRAFALANRAMLMQMVRSGEDFAGKRRHRKSAIPDPDGYIDPSRTWRPFQLAFLLMCLESTANPKSPDRELVDLIWFPTGGGKTEAYLGLMAFVIFLRRIRGGDAAAGTTVITRYTLRLLTAQQFQRAATLICACELIRREQRGLLGSTPISIGLWVGASNTPNRFADAVDLLQKILDGDTPNVSFQVDLCPWCGTEIVPEAANERDASTVGIHVDNTSVRMNCPNAGCDFHESLPVCTVDDEIYQRPPTVVVGTVDKFARLAWDERAGVILGAGNSPGPSLIIQDEFHLISGPLGTMVGAYEAAFDIVMSSAGSRPKIVASTATIRRADAQSKGVFGRPVSLFPPSGLDADDSYFVRFDRSPDATGGRLYVGVMPQGHTPLTGMVRLSAALLQGIQELPLTPPLDDAYWTLVAYHNSLRELGKSVTLAHDDIPLRIEQIAQTEDNIRLLPNDVIIELTSNVNAADIPGKIEVLKKRRTDPGAASFVASSNMISVGVDVSRLGLMLIVGQPKTTAEYIQASSRVGRSSPGLVVTLFSPSKPRDRSHYETFPAYHSSLYRSVEPTSVTPFSAPARARALHAAIVVLARHAAGWSGINDAGSFDPESKIWNELRKQLLERVEVSDPEEMEGVRNELQELENTWQRLAEDALPSGGLRYETKGKAHKALLKKFGEAGSGWETLDSMRNVDADCLIAVARSER